MKISYKIRGSTTTPVVLQFDHEATLHDLRNEISQTLGSGNFKIFRGDFELDYSRDACLLANLDIVDGERLFVNLDEEMEVSATVKQPRLEPAPIEQPAQDLPVARIAIQDSCSNSTNSSACQSNQVNMDWRLFMESVRKSLSKCMELNDFLLEGMQSWTSRVCSGFELTYRAKNTDQKLVSYLGNDLISIVCLVFSDLNVTAQVDMFRLKDFSRILITSFQIFPCGMDECVRDNIIKALTTSGIGHPTLTQVMQISLISDLVLQYLNTASIAKLGAVNQTLNNIITSQELDTRLWKKRLYEDYSDDDISRTNSALRFRLRYIQCAKNKQQQLEERRRHAREMESSRHDHHPFDYRQPFNPYIFRPYSGEILRDRSPPRLGEPRILPFRDDRNPQDHDYDFI